MILEDGRLYMRVFSSKVRAVLLSHPVVSKGLFTLIEISLGYNNIQAQTQDSVEMVVDLLL